MERKKRRGKTKAYLIDKVHERHGALTKQEAATIVDAIFGTVKQSLVDGKPVKIKNFGVFEVVSRAGRAGVSPTSGETIFIPPHRGLQFRPSQALKTEVEDPEPQDS